MRYLLRIHTNSNVSHSIILLNLRICVAFIAGCTSFHFFSFISNLLSP